MQSLWKPAGRGNLPHLLWLRKNVRSPWYSARYTGGEAEAAPLAAGGSQGELGVASVRFHSLDAECLGLLAFWSGHSRRGRFSLTASQ